jgi:hypothetical protein
MFIYFLSSVLFYLRLFFRTLNIFLPYTILYTVFVHFLHNFSPFLPSVLFTIQSFLPSVIFYLQSLYVRSFYL